MPHERHIRQCGSPTLQRSDIIRRSAASHAKSDGLWGQASDCIEQDIQSFQGVEAAKKA